MRGKYIITQGNRPQGYGRWKQCRREEGKTFWCNVKELRSIDEKEKEKEKIPRGTVPNIVGGQPWSEELYGVGGSTWERSDQVKVENLPTFHSGVTPAPNRGCGSSSLCAHSCHICPPWRIFTTSMFFIFPLLPDCTFNFYSSLPNAQRVLTRGLGSVTTSARPTPTRSRMSRSPRPLSSMKHSMMKRRKRM